MEKLITVVVPTLNSEGTIKRCLTSISKLDYPCEKIELVIVDGGSTDNTLRIVKSYDVKIFSNIRGRGAAYDCGLRVSSNDFVAFLDSDASALPKWLKSLITYFDDPLAAVVYCKEEAHNDATYLSKSIDIMACRSFGHANGAIYRKRAVLEVGGFNALMTYMQEDELLRRLSKNGYRSVWVKEVLIKHDPRRSFTDYIRQGVEAGIGAYQFILLTHCVSYQIFRKIMFTISPMIILLLVILLELPLYIFWILLILETFAGFLMILYTTHKQYRCIKYLISLPILLWISLLTFNLGLVLGFFGTLLNMKCRAIKRARLL